MDDESVSSSDPSELIGDMGFTEYHDSSRLSEARVLSPIEEWYAGVDVREVVEGGGVVVRV